MDQTKEKDRLEMPEDQRDRVFEKNCCLDGKSMSYSDEINRVMKLADSFLRGKQDRGGVPSILHAVHIAERMPDEDCTIAALLHEVLESTDVTVEELRRHKISESVLESLQAMVRRPEESFEDYVERMAQQPITRCIKYADLWHEGNLYRLREGEIGQEDVQRAIECQRGANWLRGALKEAARYDQPTCAITHVRSLFPRVSLAVFRDSCGENHVQILTGEMDTESLGYHLSALVPPGENVGTVTLRIPDRLLEKVEDWCGKQQVTLEQLVHAFFRFCGDPLSQYLALPLMRTCETITTAADAWF